MDTKRMRYIDIAKGIAMICIIVGHLKSQNIIRVVYTFHVPIFYIITGYFINNKRTVLDFLKVKFRTLVVPYIITCLVIIMVGTLKGWKQGNAISAFGYWCYAAVYGAGISYTTPFFIPAIGALWFLLATFWGSIFLRVSLDFNKYARIGVITLLFIFGYYSRIFFWFPLSIQAGACATIYMYMGILAKDMKNAIKETSQELKACVVLFAIIIWMCFIKDFQSFKLVNCDIGRGIIDVFGSVCACYVVILVSKIIEENTKYIGNFFAYFGKYSLFVLCIHIIELNLFPWWRLVRILEIYKLKESYQLLFVIFIKLFADLTCAYILSRISIVKILYGMKK